jgi:subtilisin family serine protease
MIDSGCDLSIPRLRRRVDSVKSFAGGETGKDPLGHGTAVALLISEVAPDCRLDVYQVAADRTPREATVIEALEAASESAADVINISIAALSHFQFTAQQLTSAIAEGDGSGKKYAQETPPCGLCAAADDAIAKGKLVFAAAGNRPHTASCPARARRVAAAGFAGTRDKITSTDEGGLMHSAFADLPVGPQTFLVDLSLREIDGVLGTSFACPLFSGAGAMGLSQAEFSGYIAAIGAAALPQLFQGLIRSSPGPANPDLVRQVSRWYVNAQSKLPHVHCAYQQEVNEAVARSDPSRCPFCGIFAEFRDTILNSSDFRG